MMRATMSVWLPADTGISMRIDRCGKLAWASAGAAIATETAPTSAESTARDRCRREPRDRVSAARA